MTRSRRITRYKARTQAQFNSLLVQARWDSMTEAERVALLLTDETMGAAAYSSLVQRMSTSTYDELSVLQREAVDSLLLKEAA